MRFLRFALWSATALAVNFPTLAIADDFNYPAPRHLGKTISLWATRYYKHVANAVPSGIPLVGHDGTPFGVDISRDDFCFGALQGTVAVTEGAKTTVYNVNGLAPANPHEVLAPCQYRKLGNAINDQLIRQAWAPVTGNGSMGLGVHGLRLMAFRTVAVDPKAIPIGTVLFIKVLQGWAFTDNGKSFVHDGYVIAGDIGGGVKGNHIDLFTGSYKGPPPAFVTSRPRDVFNATIVLDKAVSAQIAADAIYHR